METYVKLVYLIYFYLFITSARGAYDYALEQDLRTQMFTTNSYNRLTPPDSTVVVHVSMTLYTLSKLDITTETMESSFFFSLQWSDPRLQWSSNTTYSSIPFIKVTEDDIWKPQLSITNSVNKLSVLTDEKLQLSVFSMGMVVWPYGIKESTHCESNPTYYPFDTQSCEIRLLYWGGNISDVSPQFNTVDDFQSIFYKPNGEWEFLRYSTKVDEKTISGNYIIRHLSYFLTFRRRPMFQFLNAILPVTMLSAMTCLVYKVPSDSGEKIGFCLVVLLAFAVYLTMVSEHMPTTSIHTPYLSVYLICMLTLSIMSVFITLFVLNCKFAESDKKIPRWLHFTTRYFIKPLSFKNGCCRCCCCGRNSKIKHVAPHDGIENKSFEEKNGFEEDKQKHNSHLELTWAEIGILADECAFHISWFATVIITCITYIALIYGYTAKGL